MTENANATYKNWFAAFLFGNRIIITRETKTIANLPLLVGIIAALFAIRLTVFAVIIALILGYRFSIQKNASESFDAAVQDATEKVKTAVKDATDKVKNTVANASAQVKDAVENVKQEIKTGIESWDGVEDHH
jgi:uncharacterized protein YjbJ (UPF0337 family)